MTLARPACVLYDLDGTLVDSLPDIAAAVDDVLYSMRLPGAGHERVSTWVGNGVAVLMTHALRYALGEDPTPEQVQRARRGFHGAYGMHYCRYTVPYPGALECLQAVADQGIAQAIVTNKPEEFARLIAEKLELTRYFPVIVGGDTLPNRKPLPDPLLHAAALLGGGPALMVGDSTTDLDAAIAADMPCVLVTYGYHDGSSPRALNASEFVDTLADLPGLWG